MATSIHYGTEVSKGGSQIAPFYIARVKGIVLTPYIDNTRTPNPLYNSSADVGKIQFEKIYSSIASTKDNTENDFAYPMFSFIKQFPVIGEIVAVFRGPSYKLNDNKDSQQLFYLPAYALWNSPNHNVMPNLREVAQFYTDQVNRPGYQGGVASLPEFPKGYTYTESPQVRSLTPFEGDSILEGRFGQSVRFGSTVTGFKGFNGWSDTGTNGDPIIIIRNGQGTVTSQVDKYATTVEDINTDRTSIYLTAGQRVVLDDIRNFPQESYNKKTASTRLSAIVEAFQKPESTDYSSAASQDDYTLSTT